MQTLANIAGDKSSTIVFPLPVDIFSTIASAVTKKNRANPRNNE
jgi:hypothetical protein